jgi:DNA-binding transcriptional MocR family regulator
MTTPQHPYHIQQASELLETGKCKLPVDWSDLARRVAAHQHYSQALQASYKGNPRLLKLITENAAIALCKDFDHAA